MYHDRRLPALFVALSLSSLGLACSEQTDRSATSTSAPDSEQQSEESTPMDGTMLGDPAPAARDRRPGSPVGRGGARASRPMENSPSEPLELGADDVAGLLWMREEEQLAHDVYVALGEHWDLRIFSRIAASERRHVGAVVRLLDRFGIDDPMVDRPPGSFTISAMQQSYDELIADGRATLVDALEVGASIEEIDIADLRARVSDETDVQQLYDRLEEGSHRHLRAFVGRLDARGVGYEPTRLDAAAFAEIVSDG